MKITHIRTHENVVLNDKLENNFMNTDRNRRPATKMTLLQELNCVQLESGKDIALVPMVNIAFIKLESPFSIAKEEAIAKEAAKPKSNAALNKVKKPR